MKKAAVITVSEARRDSLGAMKLAKWLRRIGWEVDEKTSVSTGGQYDLCAFSCVFSWCLPALVKMVKMASAYSNEIWIGGPAVTFHPRNAAYVRQETGIAPHVGLDERFEREPGSYPMAYFSRGCPAYTKACGHCPVPILEGNKFSYYPDAEPAPLLLDNNLSALPAKYQQYIIDRYLEHPRWCNRRNLVDANSGFEPHTFNEDTLKRWEGFPLRCWRFGYDDLSERDEALRMMRLLREYGYSGERVRVYCLIGNEPREACHQRVREIIEAGCHPWPQRLRPLDWLGGPLPTRYDWNEPTLIAFQRFYSIKGLWGQMEPSVFRYQDRFPLAGIGTRRFTPLVITR